METIGGATTTYDYGYDAANRLHEVKQNGVVVRNWGYDEAGNRKSETKSGNTVAATYDAQDRLLTYGAASYTFGKAGDLQSRTDGSKTTSYVYDALGNLISAQLPDGTQLDYVVDARGRRVGKKVNGTLVQGFLWESQLRVAAELDGGGKVVSRFVYGTKVNVPELIIKGSTTYRVITDHLGSARLVVNTADGTVAQRMDYDEWGNVLADSTPGLQPFGFAGGLNDRDLGLVRFGARDYEAGTGRWTRQEPLAKSPRMVVAYAKRGIPTLSYAYAANSPVQYVDEDGEAPGKWARIAALALRLLGNTEKIIEHKGSLGTPGDPAKSIEKTAAKAKGKASKCGGQTEALCRPTQARLKMCSIFWRICCHCRRSSIHALSTLPCAEG